MRQWTEEQLQAIYAENETILVSAGAGSGKTAVMIERIVSLIKKGDSLNRMLIVTFTRMAASEMRTRLNERLMQERESGGKDIFQALDDLESAEIGTIHSFCANLLRKYFQTVSIDPNFAVCDETMKDKLFQEAYEEAMNQLLSENHHHVEMLLEAYDEEKLMSLCRQLYEFAMSLPHPDEWIQNQLSALSEAELKNQRWMQEFQIELKIKSIAMEEIIQQEEKLLLQMDAPMSRWQSWYDDRDMLHTFQQMLTEGKMPEEALRCYSFDKLKSVKKGDLTEAQQAMDRAYRELRDQHKKIIEALKEIYFYEEEALSEDLRAIQLEAAALALIVKETSQRFREKLKEKNLLNYEDLEQLTLELLENPETREEIRQQFDHIFVDECQDISTIQDRIFQALHGGHNVLFMVGDVKQSIYRFRKAEPSIFLERMRAYQKDPEAKERKIILQKNFRSNPGIIQAVNGVFHSIMNIEVTGMNYEKEDELIAGRTEEALPCEILTLPVSSEEREEKLRTQAQYVAEQIQKVISQRKEDASFYQYRDIAILLPAAAGRIKIIEEQLQERGIPVFSDYQEVASFEPELIAVLELLKILHNPYQDYPLISVLRMTPFLFTEGELGDIRLSGNQEDLFWTCIEKKAEKEDQLGQKCRSFIDRIQTLRFLSNQLNLADFIGYLVKDSGIAAVSGALPMGYDRQAVLSMLCEAAERYEREGGYRLDEFVSLMEDMQAGRDGLSAKTLGETENVVRIMTVHKSKGLEFPVVFMMGMQEAVSHLSAKNLQLSVKYGISLPVLHPEIREKHETIMQKAFQLETVREERAEKARLLYVAMTRARDQLFIVIQQEEKEPASWHADPSIYRITEAKHYQDWVMQACHDHPELFSIQQADRSESEKKETDSQQIWQWMTDGMMMKDSMDMVQWASRNQASAKRTRLKTTVTSLAKGENQFPVGEEEEEDQPTKYVDEKNRGMRLSPVPEKPEFMQVKRMTAAERGTVIHQVLSMIDLNRYRAAVHSEILHQEIEELRSRGIIQESVDDEMEKMIEAFLNSSLGQRMLRASEIHREWSFNYQLREQKVVLQGIIDCAFMEDGQWIIFDYKSDYITSEKEFLEKYRLQLTLYARALSEITGIPVRSAYLYSLQNIRSYEL